MKILCRRCEGSGRSRSSRCDIRCLRCGGTGTMLYSAPDYPMNRRQRRAMKSFSKAGNRTPSILTKGEPTCAS